MFFSLKALVYLGAISGFILYVTRPMFAGVIDKETLGRWALIWLTAATLAFIVPNFWLMLAAVGLVALAARRVEPDRLALFCLLITAVPMVGKDIPGFFGINRFFAPTAQVVFALVLLLPIYLASRYRERLRYADLAIYAYMILTAVLTLRASTVTDMLRTAIVFFLTALLPYYAMSRGPKNLDDFRRIIVAFAYPMVALSVVGLFELLRTWHLYGHLPGHWGIDTSFIFGRKSYRDGLLRSFGPTFGPIVFCYMFMVAAGLLLCFEGSRFQRFHRPVLFCLLGIGMLSTISRGPMVGLAAAFFIALVLGEGKFRNFGRLALVALIFLVPLSFTSLGRDLISFVPFVGDFEAGTVSYRTRLLENSMDVMMRNPLLGSVTFLDTPEMQDLVQGQGIVDIVNSYLQVALEYGFVGLFLFVSIFVSVLRGLYRSIRMLPAEDAELKQIGIGLTATLCGVLVTIATVSSLEFIPLLYWSLAGLGGAYIRVVAARHAEKVSRLDEWAPAYANGPKDGGAIIR